MQYYTRDIYNDGQRTLFFFPLRSRHPPTRKRVLGHDTLCHYGTEHFKLQRSLFPVKRPLPGGRVPGAGAEAGAEMRCYHTVNTRDASTFYFTFPFGLHWLAYRSGAKAHPERSSFRGVTPSLSLCASGYHSICQSPYESGGSRLAPCD